VVLKKDSIAYRDLSIEIAGKMVREIDMTFEVETRFGTNIQAASRPDAATMRKQPGKANAPSYIMNTIFYMIEKFCQCHISLLLNLVIIQVPTCRRFYQHQTQAL